MVWIEPMAGASFTATAFPEVFRFIEHLLISAEDF
jgi:hypothetical protein